MRKASGGDGVFGKGPGSDIFEGWYDKHVGEALAEQEALGLAGMIRATLNVESAEGVASAAEEPKKAQDQ